MQLAYTCRSEPTHAGLLLVGERVYLVFACEQHHDRLIAPRPLLERDRAEQARRRHSVEWARVGHPPLPVDPLATGAAARRLIDRGAGMG